MSRNWLIPISLSSIVLFGSSTGCRPLWLSPQEEVRQPVQIPEMSSEPEVSEKGEPAQRSDSGAPLEEKSSSSLHAQALTNPTESEERSVQYAQYEQPTSIVHILIVPPSAFVQSSSVQSSSLEIGVSLAAEGLKTVEQQAQDVGAIAAINAGFFDPTNQQTTSFVTIEGAIAADPRENDRLVNNPILEPYLEAILNRSEFRRMMCDGQTMFSIALHHAPLPHASCILQDAVGGGPQLLPTLQAVEEGFLDYGENDAVIRDAIGSLSPNARSAIGITEEGAVVFAMVAQRPEVDNTRSAQMNQRTGLSLPELADFLASIGVESALNLDGGSSSGLYVDGTMHYGRFDAEGVAIERPVKSILFLRQTEPSF